MHRILPQLPLSLSLKDEATFDNFYPGNNAEIIAALKKIAKDPGQSLIYLCGKRGQGCTHLLQALCYETQKYHLSSVYLPLIDLMQFSPAILNGFESISLVCVDDLQVIAGQSEWEEAIFYLYNRVQQANGSLIIAARDLPKRIPIQLKDLSSRLLWGVTYQLQALSDEEKIKALTMRAGRRGITLSDEVGRFILTHCPRHMSTLFAALEALDKASLAAQRRLTIPFVKEILEI